MLLPLQRYLHPVYGHTPVEYVAVREDAQAVTGRADTILMTAITLVACAAVQEYARAATVPAYRHIDHLEWKYILIM